MWTLPRARGAQLRRSQPAFIIVMVMKQLSMQVITDDKELLCITFYQNGAALLCRGAFLIQLMRPIQSFNRNPLYVHTSTPVALEYDPAGHGTQAKDEVAPAVPVGRRNRSGSIPEPALNHE